MASVVVNGDTSGAVTLSAPAVAGTVTVTLPSTNGTMAVLPTATGVLTEAAGGTGTTTGYYGFKNRIINGAMVIDQRNAGAEVNPAVANAYYVDRWFVSSSAASKFKIQQTPSATETGFATRVGAGFRNYLALTSLSAYTVGAAESFSVRQRIEGLNFSDLAWGTSSAATVTLSFWAYSSLTGTFGGVLKNSANDRSYPFSYTISAANTWEYETITIAGDTSGTWLTTNGTGIQLIFSIGTGSTLSGTAGAWAASNLSSATGAVSVVGTNGATWYVTGVQLEKGSTATSFDYRPYGTELQLCQRYYEKSYNMASIAGASTNTNKGSFVIGAAANAFWRWTQNYRVSKRGDATFTIYSTTGASGNVRLNNASDLAVTTEDGGENACAVYVSRNASLGDFFWWQYTASSEL